MDSADSIDWDEFQRRWDLFRKPEEPQSTRDPSAAPFLEYSPRRRTEDSLRRPETPVSRLGSPPAETPPPKVVKPISPFSPRVYPNMPVFNYREVVSPPRPDEMFNPLFYGTSTPKLRAKSDQHIRWDRRPENVAKVGPGFKMLSPVKRIDAESFFDESLVPFYQPTAAEVEAQYARDLLVTPPYVYRSPVFRRAERLPRSPAVEAMEAELKKDDDRRKYFYWWCTYAGEASWRDMILYRIRDLLLDRFEQFDYKNMNAIEYLAMLGEYLKHITDKVVTQNLYLPPLPADHPALSIVEQKKISVKKIIEEYRKQNAIVEHRLYMIKWLLRFDTPEEEEKLKGYRQSRLNALKALAPETRMERLTKKFGLCITGCPNYRNWMEMSKMAKPLEKELDELNCKIVELETECMEAMVDMTQFVDVASANFVNNLSRFLRKEINFGPVAVPSEAYDAAAKDLGKYLSRVYNQKKQQIEEVTKEINDLHPIIKQKIAEIWIFQDECRKVDKETKKMELEYNNLASHCPLTEWLIRTAQNELKRNELEFEKAKEALNFEKKQTATLEAELETLSREKGEVSPIKKTFPITSPDSSLEVSPPGAPIQASSPVSRSSPAQQQASVSPGFLDEESPPMEMMNISDLDDSPVYESTSRSRADNLDEGPLMNISGLQRGASFFESLDGSNASSISRVVTVPNTGQKKPLQLDVELIPQDIRRSRDGRRAECDVSIRMNEAHFRNPRRKLEQRYRVVRGTPPVSQTVGRNVDRRYGMFTPKSAFKRQYVGVRRPLFQGDFESPGSPYGTGRTTHPELMNLPEHPSIPRPLDTTMEWENPEMNPEFRK